MEKKESSESESRFSKTPFLSAKVHFNYLYFGFYALFVAALHVFHVFLIEPSHPFSQSFFLFYNLAEIVLEVTGLILIASLVREFFHRFLYAFFIFLTFLLLLTHVIDFILVRLMDISFWYGIDFIVHESPHNFIEFLYACNIPFWIWILGGGLTLFAAIGSIFLFRLSEKITDRHSFRSSYAKVVGFLGVSSLLVLATDLTTSHMTVSSRYEAYEKTLPWKTAFISPEPSYLTVNTTFKEPIGEQEVFRGLDSHVFSLQRKPDIYLFIIESLREDFITEHNAPTLYRFKKENTAFDLALSNANATFLSWFSIFYSKSPLQWKQTQVNGWKEGSVPLRLLKKMGYQINVVSASRLGFYEMDQLILGKDYQLADSFFSTDYSLLREQYEKDELAINHLIKEVRAEDAPTGRVFLVFLDSTHLDYSWPKKTGSRYLPVDDPMNFVTTTMTNTNIEGIRNRYRNALYFVDSQIERFLSALNETDRGKQSIVVLTSDHGEEFYEQGHIFHASNLNKAQTHVPLYYRLGADPHLGSPACEMTCHMDIFPTIFHYLIGQDLLGSVLDGQSIFKEERWPYIAGARFNANRCPREIFIHNGSQKVIARLVKTKEDGEKKKLRIVEVRDHQDQLMTQDIEMIEQQFGDAFHRVLN